MKKNIIKVYLLELILVSFLFFALFWFNIKKYILAIFISIFMLISSKLLKKRNINSIYKRQATILMVVYALVYVSVFYMMGLYFGFVKVKIPFSWFAIKEYIIPIGIIIVATEYIRNIFLSQKTDISIKGHKFNFSNFIMFVAMLLIDLIVYVNIYNLNNLSNFLEALGLILFAGISSNLFYNYTCSRFGVKGIIIYRLITSLYMYLIPVEPDVYLFFRTFLRMLYPLIMYIIFEKTYAKSSLKTAYREKKKNIVISIVSLTLISLLVMLISCQFRFGLVVIASDSMTGSINKGDAIIYERYNKKDTIKLGQVIMFDYNGIKTIHRVVDIKNMDGVIIYYTRGDSNKDNDSGFRTKNDIEGLIKLKVKYIGKPTLWVRSLFNQI